MDVDVDRDEFNFFPEFRVMVAMRLYFWLVWISHQS